MPIVQSATASMTCFTLAGQRGIILATWEDWGLCIIMGQNRRKVDGVWDFLFGEKANWCFHWDKTWKKILRWSKRQWDSLRNYEFAFPWGSGGLPWWFESPNLMVKLAPKFNSHEPNVSVGLLLAITLCKVKTSFSTLWTLLPFSEYNFPIISFIFFIKERMGDNM